MTLIDPEDGFASPARILISVDLPAPFGPNNAKNSPSSMVKSIPLRASNLPKLFLTLLNTMAFFIRMSKGSFLNGNLRGEF
jgi:hypothetical protein